MKRSKNFEKSFEKPLDKLQKMWYNKGVAAVKKTTAELQKRMKNLLHLEN
ncbi:MAG: hypothetical protein IJY06_02700 [Oscillospiraceae bacterium]|nr:hypothetical protein [Oscillospiraceae bacterium]